MTQYELLDLFLMEADTTGHNILAMPDFFAPLCAKAKIMKQESSAGLQSFQIAAPAPSNSFTPKRRTP